MAAARIIARVVRQAGELFRCANFSYSLKLKEESFARGPTLINVLEPVSEANHDIPILNQLVQGRSWLVGRIVPNWELIDHVIKERDDDLIISLRFIRATGEHRGQQ
jgi:hypothetical protein